MLPRLKSYFLSIFVLAISFDIFAEINPHEFIDGKAQEMVNVLKENNELFYSDKDAYENKIKVIFEPIIDFRRTKADDAEARPCTLSSLLLACKNAHCREHRCDQDRGSCAVDCAS